VKLAGDFLSTEKDFDMSLRDSRKNTLTQLVIPLALALTAFSSNVLAADVDADAAQALAKKSNCFKCHAVDKKKDGPAYKEVAAKYKGKADAEDKLFKHVTTGPKIKIDGQEETHEIVKSKDDAQIRNLVRWILSR
jgi:cytochrome c